MGKRVPRRQVVDDGIPIDPALIDPALYAPTPFNSSPSAPSHTPPHGSVVNLTPLVPTASQAENRDQVTLQQALTQAAVSQAQEAIKNAEANSYQLQRQIATQQAQLNEAESMIDLQEKSIEESTGNAKRLRTNVAQQSATTEAREQHISLLEIRLAEVNSENARISVLAQKRSESYHQQMIDMESRILDLERDLEDANTDLLEHKKLVKLEKEDWSNLHGAMQATESRKAACFGRMAEALSHLNEMMSVVSDKINGFERTMTNPYPRCQDSTDNLPEHHDRAHVSPRFSIQDLNFPATLPTVTKRKLSNTLSAAPFTITNTPSAVQPAITNNEVTDTLATNIQPQTPEPPIPFCDSEFDSLDLQFFAAEEGFQRVDWCEAHNVPYNEDYELGVPLQESPMPDAPENAKPTSSNFMTSEMAQPMFQTATHDANTEIINAPFDMAPGSGYGVGMLSEETLAGITGALQHEEQRQTNFIIPDFGAAPLAEAPTTTEFHQQSEVPIIDVTMTDAPAIDLLPPSPNVGWNGVLDPAASALSAPERKRTRQVYGFWEPDDRSAKSWDGNLYVKRTKLTLLISRPRYLNARKRWVKAVKPRIRAPIPTTPSWTMPVVSLSAIFAPPPTQIDSTMAASTDPIVAPAPIVEQAPIASVLAQQAKTKEAESERPRGPRPRINHGPGPRTYPVYKAYSVPSVRDPGALEVPVAARYGLSQQNAKDFSKIRPAQAQSVRPAQVRSVNPIPSVRTSAVVPGRFGSGLRDVHDNPRMVKMRTRVEQLRSESVNGPQAVDSGLHHPVSTPPVSVPIVAAVESPEITSPGVIRQSMSLLFKFLLMAYYLMVKVSGYAMASVIILMAVLIPLFPIFVRFILTVLQAVWQETRIKAPGLVFSLAPVVPLVSRAMLVFLGSIRRHCPSRLLLVLALLVAIEYTAYSIQWKGYERQYICHLDHLRYSRFREWPWLEKIDYWVTRWLEDDRGTLG
ncbi:hypothetical protein PENARI_c002G12178 [Penicillium arizonense]|uniref:Uncharacterized protein n=1 Tax=Penicillium arizonense TaxID=1835702 RepID=A0A1F5LWB0_PENAI|nr:hypothetical protein PENARI_c002G12178 [Penicillium arizonense]OGE57443.1 hypothetical protein PENARI_c002G12178 [Penicillium arizonense]